MFGKELKWYVGSWLGGLAWEIFVGVDAFGYGKTGSKRLDKVRGCVGVALCHFVCAHLFIGACGEAMRWCECPKCWIAFAGPWQAA